MTECRTYRCPSLSADKYVVRQKAQQEWDVGLDTADTELDQSTEHLPPSDFIRRSTNTDLDEQTVVMRLYAIASQYM